MAKLMKIFKLLVHILPCGTGLVRSCYYGWNWYLKVVIISIIVALGGMLLVATLMIVASKWLRGEGR